MEFTPPSSTGFTVYSKSGCPYCKKVKALLEDIYEKMIVVDCDEYLIKAKDEFLAFIKLHAEKEYKTFPMVFTGGKFIGGFSDTQAYFIDKYSAQ